MARKRRSFFWASYTDLMTSLFFVMLVVYVLTFLMLQREKKRLEIDAVKYRQILEVEEEVKNLEEDYFTYEEKYKRLIMTKQIHFRKDQFKIPRKDENYLKSVGKEIETLLKGKKKEGVRYLVIIEGMASNDKKELEEYNYNLSYKRAYSLFNFWKNESLIDFDDDNTEIIVAGSGIGGVGRANIERDNQRFLIQIIPKIDAK